MEKKYLSLRLSPEFDGEISEAMIAMEEALGVPSSKGFKIKMLIRMGIERLNSDGLLSKV